MIWNPIVSVIIFLVISIPSIWIGFKKGWKSALLISLTLIALNFIVLGIGILLYDQIWYVYKILFLKNNTKISIDLNVLKGAYKSRALLLVNLFSMPIIGLFTWVIHLLTKNILTKHWMPKTQKIAKNNKKILIASNSKQSKIIGGGILALSSVFISSFVVSGINVLTMPLHKKNSFSKGTDWLGKIYSAGIANNSDVPFYIDNFMKKADNDVTQGLSSLISFVDSTNTSDIDDELKKAQVIKERSSLFKELFKSPEASSKIIESILANDDKFINPLLWNEDVYKEAPDMYGNEQGYNDSLLNNGNKRIIFLEQLKNYLLLNSFKYSMPQEVKGVYTKLFKKYIDNWEETKFFKYLKVAQKYIDKNKKDLKEQKSKYDGIKIEKTSLTNGRQERINSIQKLMSLAWINSNSIETPIVYQGVQNFNDSNKVSESNWKELTWVGGFNKINTYFAKGSNNIKGTEIEDQYKILDSDIKDATSKRKLATIAEQARSYKEKNFLTINTSILTTNTSTYDYGSAEKLLNGLETDLNINKNKFEDWKELLSYRKNRLDEIIYTLLTDLSRNIKDKNDKLDNLKKKLSFENGVLNNLTKEEGDAMNDYKDSLRNFNKAKTSFESTEKNYLSAKRSLQSLNNSLSYEETNLSNKEQELKDVKVQLSNLKRTDSNYVGVSNKKANLDGDIKIIENSIVNYKSQINNQKNIVDNIKTTMDRLETEKNSMMNVRDNNYSTYLNKVSKVNSQTTKINNISAIIKNVNNDITNLNIHKTNLNNEKQKLEDPNSNPGSIKRADDEKNDAARNVEDAENKYNNFKNDYDPEYIAYKKLEKERNARYRIAEAAETKRDNQDKKIKEDINKVISDIALIEKDNNKIKEEAEKISIYDNSEVSIVLRNSDGDNQLLFSKNNQEQKLLSGVSSNARESLDYFRAKLNAMKERLKTSKLISIALHKKFDQMVDKLGDVYSNWINKK